MKKGKVFEVCRFTDGEDVMINRENELNYLFFEKATGHSLKPGQTKKFRLQEVK